MLRAVSIKQPWVELILRGVKTIEVRSWPTSYRGELWLHAGLRSESVLTPCGGPSVEVDGLPVGAIVGRCEIVDCVAFDDHSWHAWKSRHLVPGALAGRRFAWMLQKAERQPSVPFRGRLGIMRIPQELVRA